MVVLNCVFRSFRWLGGNMNVQMCEYADVQMF